MHTTAHPKIFGYLDANQKTEKGLKLEGWNFFLADAKKGMSTSIRANFVFSSSFVNTSKYTFAPSKTVIRKDVVDFYNGGKNQRLGNVIVDASCGWKVEIEDTANMEKVELQMLVPTFYGDAATNSNNTPWTWETFKTVDITHLPIVEAVDLSVLLRLKKEIFLPTFAVVDHFYANPDAVREFALKQQFNPHPKRHKGFRTEVVFKPDFILEKFESILNAQIDRSKWNVFDVNGCFQYCPAGTEIVYHIDRQDYAAMVYLSPDAPPESGTSLFCSKVNGLMRLDDEFAQETVGKTYDERFNETFSKGFLDRDQFDLVDTVGNRYNRLVLFNGRNIHAAASYFGETKEDSRLFQIFFFDLVK